MDKTAYTTEEAAEFLGVTVGRVRQMIVDGLLETERFGRAHVITSNALAKAAQRKTRPGPEPKASKEQASGPDGRVVVKTGQTIGKSLKQPSKKGGKK